MAAETDAVMLECTQRREALLKEYGEISASFRTLTDIRFRLLGGGRAMASISSEACTGCGECIAVCPVNAIELVSRERAALVAGLMGQSTGAPS